MPERVDDVVQPSDNLPLASSRSERGRGHREGRHGHALNGDERNQNLMADGT